MKKRIVEFVFAKMDNIRVEETFVLLPTIILVIYSKSQDYRYGLSLHILGYYCQVKFWRNIKEEEI